MYPPPPPAQLDAFRLTQSEVLAAWLELLPYVLGIVVYLVFIFEFYRFVARRDVFELRLRRYARGRLGRGIAAVENVLRVALYLVEHVVVYPVLITAWYLVFVVLLAVLASGLGVETLLLVAMAFVAAVRVTAYIARTSPGTWPRCSRSRCSGSCSWTGRPRCPSGIAWGWSAT